jgi:hypothetical protein
MSARYKPSTDSLPSPERKLWGFRRKAIFSFFSLATLLVASLAVWMMTAAAQPPLGWIAAGGGCFVRDDNPQPNETAYWNGGCADHLATGIGTAIWRRGDEEIAYKGDMRDGKANGRGKATWPDGVLYEGDWHDGKRNGHGIQTWRASGDRYDGEFRDDKRNGYGVFTWADGNRYEGEYRDNKRNGHGVETWAGSRYDGEYRDNRKNGHGVFIWANGDRYEGEWRDDQPNGQGRYVTSNGTFSGAWHDGCFKDGRATIALPLSSCS